MHNLLSFLLCITKLMKISWLEDLLKTAEILSDKVCVAELSDYFMEGCSSHTFEDLVAYFEEAR